MKKQLSKRTHGVLVLNENLKVLFRYQDKVDNGELAVIKKPNKPEAELKRVFTTETSAMKIKILGKAVRVLGDVEELERTGLPSENQLLRNR